MALLGRILLGIALALLALVLLLLFLPIRLRVSWDRGDACVSVRFGPARLPHSPPGESGSPEEEKTRKREKKQKKKKETEPKAAGEKGKKRFSINRDQLVYTLETLPSILGRALRRVGRRVRIAPLKVYVLVAGTDPAETAVLYGRLTAALEAGLPLLHRVIHIREQDIRLFPDFQGEEMDLIADVGISLRLWDLLVIGLCAGGSLMKWFINLRKLSDKPQNKKKTEPKTAGEAGVA